jgi:hypothetical protein
MRSSPVLNNCVLALLAVVLTTSCTTPLPRDTPEPVEPFSTDGCSFSPDFNIRSCCEQHDKVYWAGGSCEQRRAADHELRVCMSRNDRPVLGAVYYAGVRVGGSPLWPLPWRWGFGRPYGTGYSESCG